MTDFEVCSLWFLEDISRSVTANGLDSCVSLPPSWFASEGLLSPDQSAPRRPTLQERMSQAHRA